MAKFFIDRPVFAWVIAIFIMLAGLLSIKFLPISQYPTIAPPQVVVKATYPGATAKVLEDSVTSIIEQEMNGAEGLDYVESLSQSNGVAQITVTFKTGTNVELAAVDVQNRIKRVESRLPQAVLQQGVDVNKANNNTLMFVNIWSEDGKMDPIALGDYLTRNVINEIKRIPGVGDINLFGTEKAMRVWVDPVKLSGLKLSMADVTTAIKGQNAQVSAGSLAALPNTGKEPLTAGIVVSGQLTTPEEFREVVLRANSDGSVVRLKDVARVEMGGKVYDTRARLDGKELSGFAVLPTSTANALEVSAAVRTKMEELSRYFPPGVKYIIPYDTTKFVRISIHEVVKTLFEAVILVFFVMYLFLQNIRYTIIPTIAVPVALLGTFAVLNALGYSINVLTMFGMVLAIGILVDDAIVVVENVERIMATEGLPPREATRKAMGQITGALVGITVVLIAVFIPMAFFGGAVGAIYRQFSVAMVASMVFSALIALTLTPALCATLLKPIPQGEHHEKKGLFGWFNRKFGEITARYERSVAKMLGKLVRWMLVYGAIALVMGLLYWRLPTSFLPDEDQGYLITNIQLPPGATAARTLEVVKQVEEHFSKEPGVAHVVGVTGFSFSGNGQNAGLAFVPLKDWDERSAKDSSQAIAGRAFGKFMQIKDALVFPLNPPPIRELGNATGFVFRLQDRAGLGHDALVKARDQLIGLAAQSKVLRNVRVEALDDAPQLELKIDRDKANALGITFADINTALSTALGSSYVNDFDSNGRQQRVVVQADSVQRMRPEDLSNIYVRNSKGTMVPFSAFSTNAWVKGPVQLVRYNGYPAVRISGVPAPGMSTGTAMEEMATLMDQLPAGFGYEWTGQSIEEKTSGSQAPALYALSMIAVFLCLAALYESTSIPFAVMLVVPLGVFGALLGMTIRGLPNDVYFKVGLIATIGLSAKNAILIIEFAKDLEAEGKGLIRATLEAVRLRFRPIIMTSLAFILGVVPLVISTGAGSAAQHAIGTGVMSGMIAATVLAVFLVPVFFVVVRTMFRGSDRQRKMYAANLKKEVEFHD